MRGLPWLRDRLDSAISDLSKLLDDSLAQVEGYEKSVRDAVRHYNLLIESNHVIQKQVYVDLSALLLHLALLFEDAYHQWHSEALLLADILRDYGIDTDVPPLQPSPTDALFHKLNTVTA